jgi:hypothetical protein
MAALFLDFFQSAQRFRHPLLPNPVAGINHLSTLYPIYLHHPLPYCCPYPPNYLRHQKQEAAISDLLFKINN